MEQAGVAGQAVPRKRKSPHTTAIVPVAGATVALGTLQALVEQASASCWQPIPEVRP